MAIPNPPIGLTPHQSEWLPAPGPRVDVTLSWQPSAGAAFYGVRVEDLTAPLLRLAGNSCGGDPHYFCRDDVAGTTVTIQARAGHAYRWWVHAVNGDGWSDAAVAGFRMGEPPVDEKLELGPLQIFPTVPNYREIVAPSPPQWRVEVLYGPVQQQILIRGDVLDRNKQSLATVTSERAAGGPRKTILTFPVPPLAPGRYTLRVSVSGLDSVLLAQAETDYRVHTNAPDVRIDENGLLRRHSIPWFPFGFYMGEPMTDFDFARMSSWGANCAVSYGYGALGYLPKNEENALQQAQQFISRAESHGMGIFYNLGGFYQDQNLFPDPALRTGLELAVEYLSRVQSHDALLGWSLADEPDHVLPFRRLPKVLAMEQLIAELDSGHPTWLVLINPTKETLDGYYLASDLTAVDPYPIPDHPLTLVEEYTTANVQAARGVRPNWTVVQLHDRALYDPHHPSTTDEPTAEEKICMPMLALTAGATGLFCYSYADLFCEVRQDLITGEYTREDATQETLDRRFTEVEAMAGHVTSVIPALLAGTERKLRLKAKTPPTRLRQRAVELGGVLWVILANPTDDTLTVSYTLPALKDVTWGRADAPNGEVSVVAPVDATTLTVQVPARSGGTVRVERAGVLGTRWAPLPDTATDIAAGANGAVWITGKKATAGGFEIRELRGAAWTTVPGAGARRIAVGRKGPWVVNDRNRIQRREGSQWPTLPGTAHDIAVGPNEEAWIISTIPTRGGFKVRWWDGDEWHTLPGATGGMRIAVGPLGTPWIVDADKRILRHDGVRWVQLPGSANDIGIGADGTPWVIGTNLMPKGFGIFRWNGVDWVRTDSGASAITVGRDGLPLVVNSEGESFRRM
jgi:hypothetical protein